MGTAHYARKMVGYTPAEFQGLTRLQKNDVPTIWKTLATNDSQLRGEKQLE